MNPFPNGAAYQAALDDPRYTSDTPEGKAYRADVNSKLTNSPNIVPSPDELRKRDAWMTKDGVQ